MREFNVHCIMYHIDFETVEYMYINMLSLHTISFSKNIILNNQHEFLVYKPLNAKFTDFIMNFGGTVTLDIQSID